MNIRQQNEAMEESTLAPYATKSSDTQGRAFAEEQCTYRTDFQRDRDRILHSKAFRRLKQKTQVFLATQDDHYRTRLTHTLEVSQIARTIGRALRLNEDLIEAIALGHDLGHTPFGHAGERVLSDINQNTPLKHFAHNEQSVRVVSRLERDYDKGLNLTKEVLDGILNHQTGSKPTTWEGWVVQYSDKIAYLNHDIEDAISAKVLPKGALPQEIVAVLGNSKSERITTLIASLVENSKEKVQMAKEVFDQYIALKRFLSKEVYQNKQVQEENSKVEQILISLYQHFSIHSHEMPALYRQVEQQEGIDRAVTDYISGMTDGFAVQTYQRLFIPKAYL